jgi:hypothetical protein
MKSSSGDLKRTASWAIVISMIFGSFIAITPAIVVAPPLAGTLNVTFHDLAPDTNTFARDVNVTMIWLEMTASGGAVQLMSIDFTLGGTGITASEVSSVAFWDDAGPPPFNGGPDAKQQWYECQLDWSPVNSLSFSIPGSGSLAECTGPGNYIINDFETRFLLVYLTVDATADEGDMINLTIDAINTDGTVSGGSDTTRTIEVMHVFFLDNMESGQGSWTRVGWDDGHMHEPDGLWHLSQGEEDCSNNVDGLPYFHSTSTSWWYGRRFEDPFRPGVYVCNYYTHMPGQYLSGTRNRGTLTTPDVDATTGSSLVLTYWYMISTETDDPGQDYDPAHLWLYDVTDGTWDRLTTEDPSYGSTDTRWWKETINISAYAGKHIQLEFRFDTEDEINNQYLGWFVDDLSLFGKTEPHDIAVTENDVNPVITPSGGSKSVTARFSNIGTSDETNINIRLTVDGVTKDTGTIASLLSGESILRTLTWNPTELGNAQLLCMEADPVPSENILWNNKDCKLVNVVDTNVFYIYAVRSEATAGILAKDTWNYLNANWNLFGADQVIIDYTSLDLPFFTYADIAGQTPKPDILLISSPAGFGKDVPPGAEFSDIETAALNQYTLEGHGLILTGAVFNQSIPNNNDLTGLVGIKDQPYKNNFSSTTIDIDAACTGLPLFASVTDPFSLNFDGTTTPLDSSWDAGDLSTGQYCAKSTGTPMAAIVINRGVYLISSALERLPTTDGYQLLYNAMTTSQYQTYDHDVKAEDIVGPNFARVGYAVNVSATITNIGKNDESVDAVLTVNGGAPVDTTNIFLTAAGDFQRVTLSYTPTTDGVDDTVCIEAIIVGFTDEDPSNNKVCRDITAANNPPVQVFILDSWGTDNPALAPWNHLNSFWSDYGMTPVYIDYTTLNKESIVYQDLVDMYADVLVISSSYTGVRSTDPIGEGHYFTIAELNAIKQYVEEGHGLIVTGGSFDTEFLPNHVSVLGSTTGINSGSSFMVTPGVNNMYVLNPVENHPLFVNIDDHYTTANGSSLTPGFAMVGPEDWQASDLAGGVFKALEEPGSTIYGAVIAYEPGLYNSVYITNFVERSSNTYDRQLLYNAMVWGRSSVKGPSDLWIELYNGDLDLRLTWTENPSLTLDGYNIYRADAVDTFDFGSPLVTLPVGTTEYTDVGRGVGDTTNWYYIVRAYDTKGNEEQNRNIVGKYIVTLYKNHNEISLPFELMVTTTSVVFSQLGGSYVSIEAYDAMTGTWRMWDQFGGDLTDVDHKMGLRVTMEKNIQPMDFVTVGRVPGMTDIDMYRQPISQYWNFVGFPRHLTTLLPDALNDYGMMGKYDLVLWYDPLDKKAPWKWFNPNDPTGSPLQDLRPGMGIWVHTTQAGTWSLPGA